MKFLKMAVLIMLIAVIFSMCGCADVLKSLFPIYTKDTLSFSKSLLGEWKKECPEYNRDERFDEDFKICNEDGPTEKYIWRKEGDGYKVEKIDANGKLTLMKAHIVKIGNNYFLDIFPHEDQERPDGTECFILVHVIVKINFSDENIIEMGLFNENLKWIESDNDGAMSQVESDLLATSGMGIISTNAPTKDVQEFLQKYGNNKKTFPGAWTMRFKKVKKTEVQNQN